MNLTITPRINTNSNQPKETTFGCPPKCMVAHSIASKTESGSNVARLVHTLKKIGKRSEKTPKKVGGNK